MRKLARKKTGILFRGFEEYMEKLDGLAGDLKGVTEEALKESERLITPKLHQDMKKHKRTGRTENSIDDNAKVKWEGTQGAIKIGFNLADGGLASIFLMYGVRVHGTPRIEKDQKLYNDIYGAKTRKEIAKKQEEIFSQAIKKRMGG